MIIPPDVKSEQEMRLRLAILNGLTSVRSGEEMAVIVAVIVAVVLLVLFFCLVVGLLKALTRLPTLYRKHATRPTQEAGVMKWTVIGLGLICLLACAMSIAIQEPGIALATFGISVLLGTIIFEVTHERSERRDKMLRQAVLGSDTPQLPDNLTLNDVISWQRTVEQANTQGH